MDHNEQVCCKCRFWENLGQRKTHEYGDCKRHAPRPLSFTESRMLVLLGHLAWAAYDQNGYSLETINDISTEDASCGQVEWPHTEGADGCGDFEALK